MADRAVPVALAQLVADHHQGLYRYAYRLSGCQADAEDLTQQVYLIAQQKLGQVRDAASVRSWLFTILRNCYLKANQKRLALPVLDFDVSDLPDDAPEQLDTEQLQTALNSLADEFKVVVLMFYFEGLSYREIAQQLEVPPGTVMSRLARAKGHLRRLLSDEKPEKHGKPEKHQQPPVPKTESALGPHTAIRR
jgi:RNA polymerase sigma-70 factor (ECF subfamily)